jgi:intein/homing endonuclease
MSATPPGGESPPVVTFLGIDIESIKKGLNELSSFLETFKTSFGLINININLDDASAKKTQTTIESLTDAINKFTTTAAESSTKVTNEFNKIGSGAKTAADNIVKENERAAASFSKIAEGQKQANRGGAGSGGIGVVAPGTSGGGAGFSADKFLTDIEKTGAGILNRFGALFELIAKLPPEFARAGVAAQSALEKIGAIGGATGASLREAAQATGILATKIKDDIAAIQTKKLELSSTIKSLSTQRTSVLGSIEEGGTGEAQEAIAKSLTEQIEQLRNEYNKLDVAQKTLVSTSQAVNRVLTETKADIKQEDARASGQTAATQAAAKEELARARALERTQAEADAEQSKLDAEALAQQNKETAQAIKLTQELAAAEAARNKLQTVQANLTGQAPNVANVEAEAQRRSQAAAANLQQAIARAQQAQATFGTFATPTVGQQAAFASLTNNIDKLAGAEEKAQLQSRRFADSIAQAMEQIRQAQARVTSAENVLGSNAATGTQKIAAAQELTSAYNAEAQATQKLAQLEAQAATATLGHADAQNQAASAINRGTAQLAGANAKLAQAEAQAKSAGTGLGFTRDQMLALLGTSRLLPSGISQVVSGISLMGISLESTSGILITFIGTTVAALGSLARLGFEFNQETNRLRVLGEGMGLTLLQTRALDLILQQSGESLNSFGTGLRNISEAITGIGQQASRSGVAINTAFTLAGAEGFKNFQFQSKDTFDVLKNLLLAFQTLEKEGLGKTVEALSSDALGRGFRQLVGPAKDITDQVDELIDRLKKAKTAGEEVDKQSQDQARALTTLKEAWLAFQSSLAGPVADTLRTVADLLKRISDASTEDKPTLRGFLFGRQEDQSFITGANIPAHPGTGKTKEQEDQEKVQAEQEKALQLRNVQQEKDNQLIQGLIEKGRSLLTSQEQLDLYDEQIVEAKKAELAHIDALLTEDKRAVEQAQNALSNVEQQGIVGEALIAAQGLVNSARKRYFDELQAKAVLEKEIKKPTESEEQKAQFSEFQTRLKELQDKNKEAVIELQATAPQDVSEDSLLRKRQIAIETIALSEQNLQQQRDLINSQVEVTKAQTNQFITTPQGVERDPTFNPQAQTHLNELRKEAANAELAATRDRLKTQKEVTKTELEITAERQKQQVESFNVQLKQLEDKGKEAIAETQAQSQVQEARLQERIKANQAVTEAGLLLRRQAIVTAITQENALFEQAKANLQAEIATLQTQLSAKLPSGETNENFNKQAPAKIAKFQTELANLELQNAKQRAAAARDVQKIEDEINFSTKNTAEENVKTATKLLDIEQGRLNFLKAAGVINVTPAQDRERLKLLEQENTLLERRLSLLIQSAAEQARTVALATEEAAIRAGATPNQAAAQAATAQQQTFQGILQQAQISSARIALQQNIASQQQIILNEQLKNSFLGAISVGIEELISATSAAPRPSFRFTTNRNRIPFDLAPLSTALKGIDDILKKVIGGKTTSKDESLEAQSLRAGKNFFDFAAGNDGAGQNFKKQILSTADLYNQAVLEMFKKITGVPSIPNVKIPTFQPFRASELSGGAGAASTASGTPTLVSTPESRAIADAVKNLGDAAEKELSSISAPQATPPPTIQQLVDQLKTGQTKIYADGTVELLPSNDTIKVNTTKVVSETPLGPSTPAVSLPTSSIDLQKIIATTPTPTTPGFGTVTAANLADKPQGFFSQIDEMFKGFSRQTEAGKSQLVKDVDGFFGAIAGAIQGLTASSIGGKVSGAGNALGSIVGAFDPGIGGFISTLGGVLGGIVDTIGGIFKRRAEQIATDAENNVKAIEQEFHLGQITLGQTISEMQAELQLAQNQLTHGKIGKKGGQCRSAEELMLLADGSWVKFGDLIGKEFDLIGFDDYSCKLVSAKGRAFDNGIKDVFTITLKNGIKVTATENHPFFTFAGWTRLDELMVGQKIAVPARYSTKSNNNLSDDNIKMLGCLIADGSVTEHVSFASQEAYKLSEERRKLFDDVTETLNRASLKLNNSGKGCDYKISSIEGYKNNKPGHKFRQMLNEVGIRHTYSDTKFVPQVVFQSSDRQIALFLNRLFACDGWATQTGEHIGYTSVSWKLITGIYALLQRLGIRATIRHRKHKSKKVMILGRLCNHKINYYELRIKDAKNIKLFVEKVGILGKETPLTKVYEKASSRWMKRASDVDILDKNVWKYVQLLCKNKKKALSSFFYKKEYTVGGVNPKTWAATRDRMKMIGTALEDEFLLSRCSEDIGWEEIKSIEYAGAIPTVGIEVPEYHTYVTTVIEHNTAFVQIQTQINDEIANLRLQQQKTQQDFANQINILGQPKEVQGLVTNVQAAFQKIRDYLNSFDTPQEALSHVVQAQQFLNEQLANYRVDLVKQLTDLDKASADAQEQFIIQRNNLLNQGRVSNAFTQAQDKLQQLFQLEKQNAERQTKDAENRLILTNQLDYLNTAFDKGNQIIDRMTKSFQDMVNGLANIFGTNPIVPGGLKKTSTTIPTSITSGGGTTSSITADQLAAATSSSTQTTQNIILGQFSVDVNATSPKDAGRQIADEIQSRLSTLGLVQKTALIFNPDRPYAT